MSRLIYAESSVCQKTYIIFIDNLKVVMGATSSFLIMLFLFLQILCITKQHPLRMTWISIWWSNSLWEFENNFTQQQHWREGLCLIYSRPLQKKCDSKMSSKSLYLMKSVFIVNLFTWRPLSLFSKIITRLKLLNKICVIVCKNYLITSEDDCY